LAVACVLLWVASFVLAAGPSNPLGLDDPSQGLSVTPSETVETALEVPAIRSVYFVVATRSDKEGQVLGNTRGIAFAYERDGLECVLITVWHVIQDASTINVHLWTEDLSAGPGYEARVKWVNESKDIAALTIKNKNTCNPVQRNEGSIPIGRQVFAFQNTSMSRGMITSGLIGGYWNTYLGQTIICDMQSHPGHSGSPLFDYHGLLIGMIVSRTHDVEISNTFALPANRIKSEIEARRPASAPAGSIPSNAIPP
jgi:S1-C subfamily serine protease